MIAQSFWTTQNSLGVTHFGEDSGASTELVLAISAKETRSLTASANRGMAILHEDHRRSSSSVY